MKLKIFEINKIEKKSDIIEERINSFLNGKLFKFATQSEGIVNSKIYISVFYEEGKTNNTKAKCFKSCNASDIEKMANSFFKEEKNIMKWAVQTSTKSNIFSIIFYEEIIKNNNKPNNSVPDQNNNESGMINDNKEKDENKG